MTRAVTAADLADLVRLNDAYDTHWFGGPERDADEVREGFDSIASPVTDSMAILDGDRFRAAAWRIGPDAVLRVDPSGKPPYDELLAWVETRELPLAVNALSRDAGLIAALRGRGWSYDHSAFELIREVSAEWVIAEPAWPTGTRLTSLEQPELVHDLIYRRAGWASMIGHGDRELPEWQRLFLPVAVKPEEQILVWQGSELIGVALGRIFSDGAGWVSQLAVATEHRGRGIGRALLLAALTRHVAAGATRLGLQVSAKNRGALALYLDVGLTIDREWQEFQR